jgi:hypothetical protein
MSSYNSIARSRQDPGTPLCPLLGTRGWSSSIWNGHPRLKPGTITYINSPHRWFLVTFDDGRRQGYHFGEV